MMPMVFNLLKSLAKQVPWNKIIVEEFIKLATLSDDEINILKTRALGWTITKQSMTFGISESTINRIVYRLKLKYDAVQPYSDILPPRKFSADETAYSEV